MYLLSKQITVFLKSSGFKLIRVGAEALTERSAEVLSHSWCFWQDMYPFFRDFRRGADAGLLGEQHSKLINQSCNKKKISVPCS